MSIIVIKSYHGHTGRQLAAEEFREWEGALDDVIGSQEEDRIVAVLEMRRGKEEIVTGHFLRGLRERAAQPSAYDEHNIMNHAQLGIV